MRNVYFIGIGGIGMSALARYYKFKGYNVAGYDRTPSDLTFALEREGIDVHYQDQPELLPEDKNETLVVYTPAIPADLGELVKAREEGARLLSDAKAEIEQEKKAAIADIRKQVAALSVEIAEKVLRQNLQSDKAQMELIDRMLDDVNK
jgi:UDP-N-acetylmuramate-alanine ligase